MKKRNVITSPGPLALTPSWATHVAAHSKAKESVCCLMRDHSKGFMKTVVMVAADWEVTLP